MEEQGPAYPFGGCVFSGSPENISKLESFARTKGVSLVNKKQDGEDVISVQVPLERGFDPVIMDIFNEVQSGRLGRLGLIIMPGR